MPALQCQVCEKPVFHFSSILELDKEADPKIQRAVEAHRPECSGRKPQVPREEQPHRYTDGRPFTSRPKGPCAICGHGARDQRHYQDGRYL